MLLFKIIFLQVFWYLAVSLNYEWQNTLLISSIILCVLNYKTIQCWISIGHYIFFIFFTVLFGLLHDNLLMELQLVNYGQSCVPNWLISMYFIFIVYYGDVFNYLSKKTFFFNSIIGGIGGLLAYFAGAQISQITILNPMYYLFVASAWSLFFPISLKVFYDGLILNKILDMTIYFSFDKSGFIRHTRNLNLNYEFHEGSFALVTGGTSGIGLAVAKHMANKNINVIVTARNLEKGERVQKSFKNITFKALDMSQWGEIDSIVSGFNSLDYIVLNAGGMPETFQTNEQGVELQFSSQLCGHYFLIKKLKEHNKLNKNAKIVWVSSGGMYLSNMDLNKVFRDDSYDKVATYASVKRAQVTLLPYLKKEFPDQIITAMHPGWVETAGLILAIPKFNKAMAGRLRTPIQGADCILWLLSKQGPTDSGGFYFDHKKVPTHFFHFTKKSEKQKSQLIQLIKSIEEKM